MNDRELLKLAYDALGLINHRGNTDEELQKVGLTLTMIGARLEDPEYPKSDLIVAAKAVIRQHVTHGKVRRLDINNLRNAVERAEKHEAVGFEEFLETKYPLQFLTKYNIKYLKEAWTAARQAERERIKDLLRQSSDWFEDDQMAQANWLLEKIDGPDGI